MEKGVTYDVFTSVGNYGVRFEDVLDIDLEEIGVDL